jgi:uncharacterized protein YebE (UPF0316 family)
MEAFFGTGTFKWVILPLLIFTARIFDVSFGTMRIVFISRGKKFLAPVFGFFEVLIWLIAISQIMKNLTNVFYYLVYAGGYATGNFVGLFIEEKLAMGVQVLRVITNQDATELVEFLRSAGYGVTSIDGQGISGKVNLIFMILRRSALPRTIEIIQQYNPNAFYSVEDVRTVSKEILRPLKLNLAKDKK